MIASRNGVCEAVDYLVRFRYDDANRTIHWEMRIRMSIILRYRPMIASGVLEDALRDLLGGSTQEVRDELAAQSLQPQAVLAGIHIEKPPPWIDVKKADLVVTLSSPEIAYAWKHILVPRLRRELGEGVLDEIPNSRRMPDLQSGTHRPFIAVHDTFMSSLPPRRAAVANVAVTRRAAPALLGVRGAPSRWSLFWGRGSLYEIDLGLHHTTFDIELPSMVDLVSFRGHVSVEWRVSDPVRVVKDHVSDIREALAPALVGQLALDTRRFRVDEVYAAERAIAAGLHNNDLGPNYGLATTIRIQLSADSGAAEHAVSRRALQQQIEMDELRGTHRLRLETTEENMILRRIRMYRDIIAAGDVEQFALQLARNPEGVESVVRMAREVRREEQRDVTDFLSRLLESGAIDRWEVQDTVQTALDWLKESTDRVVQSGEARIPWARPTVPATDVARSRNIPSPTLGHGRDEMSSTGPLPFQPQRPSRPPSARGFLIFGIGGGSEIENATERLAESMQDCGVGAVTAYSRPIGQIDPEEFISKISTDDGVVFILGPGGSYPSDFGLGYLAESFKEKVSIVAIKGMGGLIADSSSTFAISDALDASQWIRTARQICERPVANERRSQSPCLISYSNKDSAFVARLAADLDAADFATRLDVRTAESNAAPTLASLAICLGSRQLLVISDESVRTEWIRAEIGRSIEIERNLGREVLIPVLVDSDLSASEASQRLGVSFTLETIVNFQNWSNHDSYRSSLRRLAKRLTLGGPLSLVESTV